jgi:hypothetical protein
MQARVNLPQLMASVLQLLDRAVEGTHCLEVQFNCNELTAVFSLETYDVATDPRVSVVGIFNSGEFGTSAKSTKVTKPIFYFLGGSSDIAYANGERDYKNLPATTPKWKGNLPVRPSCFLPSCIIYLPCLEKLTIQQVGHMATWSQTNSGKFGKAEWLWLDWTLKGNAASGQFFTAKGAEADGWQVEQKNMEKFVPPPPYA